ISRYPLFPDQIPEVVRPAPAPRDTTRDLLRRSAEGGDAAAFLGDRFQVFDKRPALLVGQQRADRAVAAWAVLEGVAGVGVAQQSRIHQKSSSDFVRIQSDFD